MRSISTGASIVSANRRLSAALVGVALMMPVFLVGDRARAGNHAQGESEFPPLSEMPPSEFPEPVDIVIEHEFLDEHAAAAAANPGLYDGLRIGVNLDLDEPLVHGVPPETLSQRQRSAVAGRGGAEAAALDAALDAQQRAQLAPVVATPAACIPRQRGRAQRQADTFGIFLACRGDEPSTQFHQRPSPPGARDAADLVAAALEALVTGPTPMESDQGYYSLLEDQSDLVNSVTLSNETLTIDFSQGLQALEVASIGPGTVFLEQVINTAFQVPGFSVLRLTLEDDCLQFAYAVGGDICAEAVRNGETNSVD